MRTTRNWQGMSAPKSFPDVRATTYIKKIKNFKQPYISRWLVEAHNVIIYIYILCTTNLRCRLREHNDEERPTAATSRSYYNM